MEYKDTKKKIREIVTPERIAVAAVSIVTYSYVMSKFGYLMVRPAGRNDTHVLFRQALTGKTKRVRKD